MTTTKCIYTGNHVNVDAGQDFNFAKDGIKDLASFAQHKQDHWIYSKVQKQKGTFVDIGCATPCFLSNTALLEKVFGWRGIALDMTIGHGDYFESPSNPYVGSESNDWSSRTLTKLYEGDALEFDYEKAFSDNDLPEIIDCLSIDLEPPSITLDAFERLPHEKYKFRTIVFEHDCYRASQYGLGIQPSDEFFRSGNYSSENLEWLNHTREVISSYGYKLDAKYSQDDFYVLEEE